jgi:deoxyribonuclease-4
MFHIGTAGYPDGYKDPLNALDIIKSSGLDALEVQFVRQARMSEDKATAIGERANDLGVLLSAHAPYYINFNSRNPETVEKSVGWVTKTARIAHHLGARLIVVHSALYHDMPPTRVTERVIEGVGRCLGIMEEEGFSPLIGLEVMGKRSAWGRIPEIGEVVDSLEGVVPMVDFAHLHALGGALRSVKDVIEALDLVREYHRGPLHCHYSSVEYGERGERKHLPLKAGEPDFGLVAEALSGWKEDVTIISETTSPLRDAKTMREMVDSLAENRIQ